MRKALAGAIFLSLLVTSPAFSQNYTGTYVLSGQGNTVTIVLNQGAQGQLTGSMSSTTGARFQISGIVEEGIAIGTCVGNQGGSYFEGDLQGNELYFTIIGADSNNQPDYNNMQHLTFIRQGSGGGPAMPSQGPQQMGVPPGQTGFPQQVPQQGWGGFGGQQGGAGQMSVASNEICNPNWRFKFVPPTGWKKMQENGNIVVLGNDGVIGMIMVFSHTMTSLDQVKADMQRGISSGGIILTPTVPVRTVGNSVVIAELQGSYNGQPARAHAMGTLIPNGGGAYIMCISPPDKFTTQLSTATDAIGAELQYFPPGVPNPMQQTGGYNQPMQQPYDGGYNPPQQPYGGGYNQPMQQPYGGGYSQSQQAGTGSQELVRHFSGTWKNMTETAETTVTLLPNGTFEYYFSSTITGGTLSSKYGGSVSDFGMASENSASGRWSVQGNKQQGIITYAGNDGSRNSYRYNVHVKNGQPYWNEYMFEGVLYYRSN